MQAKFDYEIESGETGIKVERTGYKQDGCRDRDKRSTFYFSHWADACSWLTEQHLTAAELMMEGV